MTLTVDLGAAWTDAVLSLTALAAALWCWRAGALGRMAAVGYAVLAFAALVGACRFVGMFGLIDLHEQLTGIAATLAVPLVGLAVISGALPAPHSQHLRRAALVVLPLATYVASDNLALRTALGAMAFGGALVACARLRHQLGAIGAAIAIFGGLVVEGDGAWLGLSRTGWFHLTFAVGMAMVATTARRLGSTAR